MLYPYDLVILFVLVLGAGAAVPWVWRRNRQPGSGAPGYVPRRWRGPPPSPDPIVSHTGEEEPLPSGTEVLAVQGFSVRDSGAPEAGDGGSGDSGGGHGGGGE